MLGEHLSLDARGAYLGSSNLESATAVRELLLKRMVAHLEYDDVSQITDNINALVVCKVSDVAT